MKQKHAEQFKDFRPSMAECDHYWRQWMTLNRYRDAEDALARLFRPRRDKELMEAEQK